MTSRVLTGPLWMCRSVLTEGPCVTLVWPVLSGCPSLIGHCQHLLEPGLTASGNWTSGSLARGFSNNSCSNFNGWSWSNWILLSRENISASPSDGRSASTVVEFPEARGSESVIACRHSLAHGGCFVRLLIGSIHTGGSFISACVLFLLTAACKMLSCPLRTQTNPKIIK